MAVVEFMGVAIDELIRNKYIHSLLTLVIFFIAAKLVAFIAERFILKLTAKTKTKVDDLLIKKTHGPVSLLLFLLGIKLAIIPLKLQESINVISHRLISTISIIVLIYTLIVVLDIIISALVRRHATRKEAELDENLIKISAKTSRVVLVILALLFILNVWEVKIGALLASLGIIGVAVAFGLQNTLGNIFGGVSLLLDRSIRVGDIIRLDPETAGTVIDIGLRSTRIKTWDNEVIIVPNGQIASSKIKNYVLPDPTARIVVPFSVAYGSDVEKVKKIVMKEIKKLDHLDKDKEPRVMFLEMGASSLDFKAYVYLTSYKERFATKEKLNCVIYNTLNKNKVNIPFPQMDVHLQVPKKRKRIKV